MGREAGREAGQLPINTHDLVNEPSQKIQELVAIQVSLECFEIVAELLEVCDKLVQAHRRRAAGRCEVFKEQIDVGAHI